MAILNHGSTIRTADGGQSTTTIVTASNIGTYGVAANSTYFIGTTQNVFNRASGAQTLTGVSIDGNAANITAYTINQNVGTGNTPSFAGLVSSAVTNYAFLQVADTNNFWITPGNNNWGLYFETSAGGLLGGTGDSNRLGFVGAGNARFYVDLNNGNGWFGGSLTANTDSRAPIFYDSNNTAYYLDAASTTVLNALSVSVNNGLNPAVGTWHTSSEGKARFYFANNSTTYFRTGNDFVFRNNSDIGVITIDSVGNLRTSTSGDIFASYSLHVGGTGFASADFRAPIFYDSANTAYYLDPANTGTSLLVAGNVGVGTTNPLTRLHVAGAIGLYQTAGSTYLYYDHSGVNTWRTGIFTDNTSTYIIGHDTGGAFATKIFAITMAGNVGIGTTSPSNPLHINTSANEGILVQGSTAGSWMNFKSSTSNLLSIGADGTLGLGFYNRTSSTYLAIISNSGSLGIGTTSPSQKLHVVGTGFASTDFRAPIFYDSDNTAYYINPASNSIVNSLTFDSNITIYKHNDRNLLIQGGGGTDAGLLGRGSSGQFAFQVYGSGSGSYGFLDGAWAGWDIRKVVDGDLFLNDNNTYYLNPGSTTNLNNLTVAGTMTFGTLAYTTASRRSKNSSNVDIETVTGLVSPSGPTFLEIRGFCPPTMYRTTGDRPAPYGLGFGNGSESGGIMPIGSGDNLQEIMLYGANSGPTTFTFKRQIWEGATYDPSYSNYYGSAVFSINTGTGAVTASTDIRSPIFYDSDNTAYYANPSAASIFNGLKLVGSGNEASGSDYSLWIQGSSNDWGIGIIKTSDNYGITYNLASSHTYGIQGAKNGSEYFRVGTDMLYHDTRLQAPIFYDSNNTAYYLDPNNTGTSLNTAGAVVAGTYVYSTTYLQAGNNNIYPNGFANTLILNAGNSAGNNWIAGISIAQGGNVGIGTTSPSVKLAVDGEASFGDGSKLTMIGLDINSGVTPNFIKIRTKIPFASGAADFTINIKGFRYGSVETTSLMVCWHYYLSTFYNPTISSAGSFAPTVKLSAEDWDSSGTPKVCIVLVSPGYWPKLYVESMYSSAYNDAYADGWDWVDADATGTGNNLAILTYKSNFGNSFVMLSDGNVGIGTISPSQKLHVVGTGFASTDFRSPIFYDSNNTSYYIDAASTSSLNALTMAGTITGASDATVSFTGGVCTAASYNYILNGANDTGNKLVIFVNGSTRTADGGVNALTIRNDGGAFVLGLGSYLTSILGSSVTINGNVALHAGNYTSYPDATKLPLTGGTLASTNDQILTLNKSSGTAWNYIGFSQAGTRRFYFGLNASFEPELGVDNGGTFRVVGGMTVAGNAVLTSTSTLTAGNLSGTIPSGVLGNSTHYVGTTAIALNRGSASQTLTGVSIDGSSASCTGNAATATRTSSQSGYPHAGTGMFAFYNWGGTDGGTSAPSASTYTTGISVGSNPGDQAYGFQIANNMWNTGLWTRNYNSSFGAWIRLLDSSNYVGYSAFTSSLTSTVDARAPIFYDSNNTAYYIDAASTSVLNRIDLPSGSAAINTTTPGTSAYQLNFTGQGTADNAQAITWGWSTSGAQAGIYVQSSGGYGTKMYIATTDSFATGSKTALTIDHTGVVTTNRNYLQATGSLRAPIFYDSDNTAYYIDAASTSNLNVLNAVSSTTLWVRSGSWAGDLTSNGFTREIGMQMTGGSEFVILSKSGQGYTLVDGSYYAYEAGGFYSSFNSSYGAIVGFSADSTTSVTFNCNVKAPIYYDSANTSFYVDPATGTVLDNFIDLGIRNSTGVLGRSVRIEGVNDASGEGSARIFFTENNNGSPDAYGLSITYNGTGSSPVMPSGMTLGGANAEWAFWGHDNSVNGTKIMYGFRNETNLYVIGSVRSPIFYDSNDTTYYIDAASTSQLNQVASYYLRNLAAVSTDHQFGLYFNNSIDTAYAIYREGGAWTNPYPDLRIAFHTGIKIGANAGYNGIRFYDDYTMATQVMSVNNSGDGLGANNVYVNNSLQAGSSLRAPIFYDSNDTTYYTDPASTSNILELKTNRTWYDSSASAWGGGINMGGNNPSIGFQSTSSTWWYMLHHSSSAINFYRRSTSGSWNHDGIWDSSGNFIWQGSSVRAPIFYDQNNTAYYIDAASTSNLNAITAAGDITAAQYYTGGWFRNNSSGNGLYNQSTGQHFYSDSANYWNVASSAGAQGIRLRTGGYNGTVRGYFYADTNNDVGFLNQDGSWRLRVVGGDYALADGSSIRGQIFYDSNNTTYYIDAASTSNLNGLNIIDGNLELYKSQTVDMSNTTTYSTSNYYPVTISVPTEGCIIQIQNNLNSNVPSWATHAAGFTLNLKWRTNGFGWGTTQVRRIIDQYYELFANQTICGGITQMGNSSTEVVWLRGGGQYYFKFSRNLSATAQSATYTVSSQSVTPTSTAQNTIWSSASGSSIQYNDQTISTTNMYTPVLYDWNNSAYYVDPSSTSNLVGLTVANTITGSITGNAGGSSASCTGNAATATTLQTARNINGTSFNGSAAITTATWGTARTITIGSTGKSVDGSGNVSWSLAEIGAAATNQTMFIGTTSVAINRTSASQTLTGVSIDGNAATVTNGMYLSGDQFISGAKYFTSNKGSTSTVGANNTYSLEAYSSDAGAAGMSFHRGGYYAVNMGLDPDNVMRIGGWSAAANRWELDMSGNNWVASSFRSPIYYDSNDTSYYIDAASTSRVNILYVANSIADSSSVNGRILLYGNLHIDAYGSYDIYCNYYSGRRFRTFKGAGTGAEIFRTDTDGIVYAYEQLRTPILYDHNNTNYYVDPASTSILNLVRTRNTFGERIAVTSAASTTVDTNFNVTELTMSASITTLTLSNIQASTIVHMWTIVTVGNGTTYSITWPAAIKWPGGTAPTITSTNAKRDIYQFVTYDGGTNIYAIIVGQNL